MKNYLREPVNALTHLSGAVLSLIGMIIMLCVSHRKALTIFSIIVFGLSLIALYTTSSIYHLVFVKDAILQRLRKLDHAMIFVLIAGTYTPFCLLALDGYYKWGIIISVWTCSIIGIILKLFWMNMPRWVSTGFYIIVGWIAIFAFKPFYVSLSVGGFTLLLVGGIMYTIGGVIYGLKKPNFIKGFGFHEIFHIFVMLGSLCHYFSILYVV